MNPVQALVESAVVYDTIQHIAGAGTVARRLAPVLRDLHDAVVLDAGAGTGLYASLVPASSRYVWLDNDREKLRRYATRRAPNAWCVLGDATRLALADKSVDWTLCTHLTHHLTDAELSSFVAELKRVSRAGIVLEDCLRDDHRWTSRALWSVDRGSHPRGPAAIVEAVASHFNVQTVTEFSRLHRYVLIKATAR